MLTEQYDGLLHNTSYAQNSEVILLFLVTGLFCMEFSSLVRINCSYFDRVIP